MKVKVQVGEWIAVYHNVVGCIDIPDEIPINEANAMFYINEEGVDIEKEDIDWSTLTHEEWDSDGVKILDMEEEDDNTKNVR